MTAPAQEPRALRATPPSKTIKSMPRGVPTSPTSDAELVRAAQAGEIAALGLLLERHRARLLAVASSHLGPGAAAEDAVQDTFVIALRRIGDVREPAAAGAWLQAVVRSVCLQVLRRPIVEESVAEPGEPAGALQPGDVERALERTVLREWLWTALGRLSEPLRLAVLLRHFSSASSYEAIAALSGVPVGTVRSRLAAAKQQLADALLATAEAEHADWRRDARERVLALQEGYEALARGGGPGCLADAIAEDVVFALGDGRRRRGRAGLEAGLGSDFEAGVRWRPRQIVAGPGILVAEAWLDSPPEAPDHCPPEATQVHLEKDGRTRQMTSYYGARPSAG
jgi:RNA polymerase sigma-70 factor (ECF subfamily)